MPKTQTPTQSLPTLLPTQESKSLLPSQILDLTNWKITMPFSVGAESSDPVEIKQPDLATYKIYPWFFVSASGDGIVFRAPVTGVTTSGSKYPRSELREMTERGMVQASWSSTEGKHVMSLDEAILALPKVKQQVVAGQIHDDTSDIIFIRLNYPKLLIAVDGNPVYTLDHNYQLGRRFQVQFVVENGKTDVYYNNSQHPVYTLDKQYQHAYFKAGVYTQSNCSTENNKSLCINDNYGEVTIYHLTVTHQ